MNVEQLFCCGCCWKSEQYLSHCAHLHFFWKRRRTNGVWHHLHLFTAHSNGSKEDMWKVWPMRGLMGGRVFPSSNTVTFLYIGHTLCQSIPLNSHSEMPSCVNHAICHAENSRLSQTLSFLQTAIIQVCSEVWSYFILHKGHHTHTHTGTDSLLKTSGTQCPVYFSLAWGTARGSAVADSEETVSDRL